MYVHACLWWMEAHYALKPELQVVVIHAMWVLGIKPAPSQTMNQIKYSSARVLCALNYFWAISPAAGLLLINTGCNYKTSLVHIKDPRPRDDCKWFFWIFYFYSEAFISIVTEQTSLFYICAWKKYFFLTNFWVPSDIYCIQEWIGKGFSEYLLLENLVFGLGCVQILSRN